jgi:hypothetical protein
MEFVRAHAQIPFDLNERLKKMARDQGKTADAFIGELLLTTTDKLDQMVADQERARLRQLLGPKWLELLSTSEPEAATTGQLF